MSELNPKLQYRSLYDGNAAYDLEWISEEAISEEPVPEKINEKKQNFSVSLGAVFGFAVVVCLFVGILLSYIQYTEIAAGTVSVRNSIAELTEENRKLTVAFEQTFDINEIEVYAQSELKMSHPAKDQVSFISAETDDDIRVFAADDANTAGLRESFTTFISTLLG